MNRHQVADLVATVIWGQDTANATRLGTLVVDALVEHGVLLLNQTTPGSPEAEVAYVESLRKRAEDAKASADHRALVIGSLMRKVATACELLGEVVNDGIMMSSWTARAADFIRESTTVAVTHESPLSIRQWLDAMPSDVVDAMHRYDDERQRGLFLVHLLARDDRPANVMSPDGKSVLGVALPAEYEDRRACRMWGVRCYRNGVKAHLVHDETGELLVFQEAIAAELAKRKNREYGVSGATFGEVVDAVMTTVDLRYEPEQQP